MMRLSFKSLLVFLLVAAVSSSVAVVISSYLISKNQNNSQSSPQEVFQQSAVLASLPAAAGSLDFTEAAERTVHAVVHIKSSSTARSSSQRGEFMDPFEFFFGPRGGNQRPQQQQPRIGSGSGVIISTDGYIITNNHVIDRADELEVTLNDNRKFKARVVGTDSQTDIALVKIDGTDFPTIPFGDSEKLKVGEWVLAVGNPFNLTSTVTAGIVSAKSRAISFGRNDMSRIQSFIQTDAAVNPGNSGGALVNTRGELVGINTAIFSETGNFAGYSFAVPVSIAGKVVADLKQFGSVQRAVLGVVIQDVQNVEEDKRKELKVLEGAYVADFAERSTAKAAGIQEGDVIIEVNGTKVRSANSLQEQISKYRPGDKVNVKVDRKGATRTFNIELHNAQGNTSLIKAEDTTEVLGAAYKELTDKQKQELNVTFGLEVTGVTDGKLKEAGITKGFIITEVNSKRISKKEDLDQIVDDILKGRSEDQGLFIKGFYPNGRTRYYAIDLADK